jgi:hypothetical protein
MWDAITTNDKSSQHEQIVFYVDDSSAALLYGNYKFYYNMTSFDVKEPEYIFDSDQDSDLSYQICSTPSLMDDDDSSTLLAALKKSVASLYHEWGPYLGSSSKRDSGSDSGTGTDSRSAPFSQAQSAIATSIGALILVLIVTGIRRLFGMIGKDSQSHSRNNKDAYVEI